MHCWRKHGLVHWRNVAAIEPESKPYRGFRKPLRSIHTNRSGGLASVNPGPFLLLVRGNIFEMEECLE